MLARQHPGPWSTPLGEQMILSETEAADRNQYRGFTCDHYHSGRRA